MNTRLRLYAFGCALVLCVHSLTPRSTFAQPNASASGANEHSAASDAASTRGGAEGAVRAGANERIASPQTSVTAAGADAEAKPSGVVNLNTATAAELERLPRIGPARAQAILALRTKLTHFSKVEQLLRVKGIGRATFRKLRPMLALDGPTTLPEPRAR